MVEIIDKTDIEFGPMHELKNGVFFKCGHRLYLKLNDGDYDNVYNFTSEAIDTLDPYETAKPVDVVVTIKNYR